MDPIPFNALAVQDQPLREQMLDAVRRVVERGRFVLGEEVAAFEQAFAPHAGCAHAIGVASGTDALRLALEVAGVGRGDEVVTASLSATFTALAISALGARPVFCDVDPVTLTMDPRSLEAALSPRARAILPVHLYGQCADMDPILDLASRHGLEIVEDCAQAHGAHNQRRAAGSIGEASAVTFYPTKNLGAIGDGGAVTTNDDAIAERLRRLRNGGQGDRYRHVEIGVNSRLDEIQAAVLSIKLTRFEQSTDERRLQAARYDEGLTGIALPSEGPGRRHVYHLYVVRHPKRDELAEHLKAEGIGTIVHYPIPIHLQPAYASLGMRAGSLPVTEAAANEVLSLPLHPGLTVPDQHRVIEAVNAFTRGHA